MREISTEKITETISSLCIRANHYLAPDMKNAFCDAVAKERSELGKKILGQLEDNLKIAEEDMIPICQDTGMAVVFIKVGQEVHITGG
ncbi:MAG: fumarate hydratase, partial [Lachnospiraceae bacterium]|nr:fumarate hydratase [Lachnospiraceae bacterium]